MTRFYEDNGGGIHAIVRRFDGKLTNVLTGFQFSNWRVGELLSAAMDGFSYSDEYDPDDFSGADMATAASEIGLSDELIAEVSANEITLYPNAMGFAGKKLFGLN